jgi:hypothetical protein
VKRLLSILFFAATFPALATDHTALNNDTIVTTWSDSFGFSGAGQGVTFFIVNALMSYNPSHYVDFRDHSRSGADNVEMLTNRLPAYGIPDAGASYGITNGLNIFFVSGNDNPNSNGIYGTFKQLDQYPTNTYTTAGVLTHSWSQSNPADLYSAWFIGDVPYLTDRGSEAYSHGARSAGIEDGIPFVDTYANISNAVAIGGSDEWLHPNNDHPDKALHLCWALTTLLSLGMETNTFTAVIDFESAVVVSTNHCTIGSVSLTGNTLTVSDFHADRMACGFYVPNGTTTNDCRGAFALMPELGNAFYELLRVQNLPSGIYRVAWENGDTFTATSTQLAAGYNLFTNYSNPFFDQKSTLLCDLSTMRNVLCSDNATMAVGSPGVLLDLEESAARGLWPVNTGVDNYIAAMRPREAELIAQDVVTHGDAQQVNHTIILTLLQNTPAPFHL